MANPQISALLAKVNAAENGIVPIVDNVLELLEADGKARFLYLLPMTVGVHPENRFGAGVCGCDVLALGRTIVKDGWSQKATSHAVCVEDDPKERRAAKWTAECVKNTTGFARVQDGVVRYGSLLSCTHTNQFLVSVFKAVQAPGCPELRRRRPSFAGEVGQRGRRVREGPRARDQMARD